MREVRVMPLELGEIRGSGKGDGSWTMRGHAAVFNRLSLDLGGFREKIAPHAFEPALDKNPDVHALWDHATWLVLGRTRNGTLELREDPIGLHMWTRVAPTSYGNDLKVLMERGDIDGASFAFTVERDEWTTDDKGDVTRTITEIRDLYDVTVTAQGAYTHASSEVVQHLRTRLEAEVRSGRLPQGALRALPGPVHVSGTTTPVHIAFGPQASTPGAVTVTPYAAVGEQSASQRELDSGQDAKAAPEQADQAARSASVKALQDEAAAALQAARDDRDAYRKRNFLLTAKDK